MRQFKSSQTHFEFGLHRQVPSPTNKVSQKQCCQQKQQKVQIKPNVRKGKKTPLPSKPKPRNPLPPRSRAWARSESNALPNKAPPPNVT
ncbi:hypothetical protein JHK86_042169 [Glycine max]|nr:hypothetical protein JHK86_042169 [Glycine max]